MPNSTEFCLYYSVIRRPTGVYVLCPILFLLYTAELFDVIAECGFTAHSFADDTQVYICTPASDYSDAMRRLSDCPTRIRDWMAINRLKLKEDTMQVIWLGTRQQLNKSQH